VEIAVMEPDTVEPETVEAQNFEPGTVEWIEGRLERAGGAMDLTELEATLAAEPGAPEPTVMRDRLRHSPRFVMLPENRVGLTRDFLQGAFFRYTVTPWELERGVLLLNGTELSLVAGLALEAVDQAISWKDVGNGEPQRTRLARQDLPDNMGGAWVLPALGAWYAERDVQPGDDVVVHVRDLATPLLVIDRVPFLERDEGPISRRNARLVEAAIEVLTEEPSDWMTLDRLLNQLVARYDFRSPYPPDSLGQRLVIQDNRFTLSKEGREVRLSHFHHDETAIAYLSHLRSPEEALTIFFEEYPPTESGDREKALRYLEALWKRTPRPELGGLTPLEAEERRHKIIPFPRSPGAE
jgi:hypothetical protein